MKIISPWLIQRGNVLSPERRTKSEQTISKTTRLDYMGSSEFEFGALPKSLREIRAKAEASPDTMTVREMPEIKDRDGRPLMVIGVAANDLDTYSALLTPIAKGEQHIKERTEFDEAITPIADLPSYHALRRGPPAGHRREPKRSAWMADQLDRQTSFWWDLTNGVMMTFDASYAKELPEYLKGSWAKMDALAAEKEAEAAPAPAFR